MAIFNCPECDKKISDKASACPNCGCPIDSDVIKQAQKLMAVKCFGCGKEFLVGDEACPHCGTQYCAGLNIKVNIEPKELSPQPDRTARCPKCSSASLSAKEQGFGLGKAAVGGVFFGPLGLLGGMIGRNDTVVTCLNYGHEWTP